MVVIGLATFSLVVATVLALLVIVLLRSPTPDPRTVGLRSGSVVFADSFARSNSGWPQTTLASGTTVGYGGGGYLVLGRGSLSHYVAPPYATALQAMAITATASVDSGDPRTSGFGVRCNGATAGDPAYAFFIDPDGEFLIDRYNTATAAPLALDRGAGPQTGLGRSSSLTAACIVVSSDGTRATVRLVLEAGGAVLADITDGSAGSGRGWTSALVTSTTASQPSRVDFIRFAIRNLDA